MDIKVEIDPAAVEKKIVDSIIHSGIGKQIDKAIQEMLTANVGGSWGPRQTIVEKAIRGEVETCIGRIIHLEIEARRDEIAIQVRDLLTPDVIREMSSTAVGIMAGRLQVKE